MDNETIHYECFDIWLCVWLQMNGAEITRFEPGTKRGNTLIHLKNVSRQAIKEWKQRSANGPYYAFGEMLRRLKRQIMQAEIDVYQEDNK